MDLTRGKKMVSRCSKKKVRFENSREYPGVKWERNKSLSCLYLKKTGGGGREG